MMPNLQKLMLHLFPSNRILQFFVYVETLLPPKFLRKRNISKKSLITRLLSISSQLLWTLIPPLVFWGQVDPKRSYVISPVRGPSVGLSVGVRL